MRHTDYRPEIVAALAEFATAPLPKAATGLFDVLGYRSDRRVELASNTAAGFRSEFDRDGRFSDRYGLPGEWLSADLLFQLTSDEVRSAGAGMFVFESAGQWDSAIIESYLFMTVELKRASYSRTQLAGITRAVNRLFPMPVMLLFKHGARISLAVIRRRLHKRDQSRDVLEKVTLVKDVDYADPVRAHVEILRDLSLPVLFDEFHFHNFPTLHEAWEKRLDSYELTVRFYRDIANWYFWALSHDGVVYPRDVRTEQDRSIFWIRLLTRLIFCWFLQEKGLIPRDVFRRGVAEDLLADLSPQSGAFYRAFLQNLFFATLNQPIPTRKFRSYNKSGGRDGNRGTTNLYRYRELLTDPDRFLDMLRRVPFVNGGLFDCLDTVFRKEENRSNVRVDDFSEEKDNGLCVPNELFFGDERKVDLSEPYQDQRKRKETARGLIGTLSRYKFTVEENTPLEHEIALDPELLGKVFENLLASYNEETRTTARKATGSFYTPREIVDYMVNESLVTHLGRELADAVPDAADVDRRLRELLAAPDAAQLAFSQDETEALINAIDRIKIIDPACGSGAFPMGALHRLVDLLARLDPNNRRWKEQQLAKAQRDRQLAERLEDDKIRETTIREADERIADIRRSFDTRRHALDFARKLYLIENCIYGVDIQPIACQIAKLRLFIALIVDQNVNPRAENLGVRPLPNLETRIVAADTLVPIEKARDHQFDLLDVQVRPLRRALERVRHEHFNARTPERKADCRKRDADLRGQIAALLRGNGMPAEAAKRLADWDPYDQNARAGFFDSEWMFGLPVGRVRLTAESPPTLLGSFGFVNEVQGQMELLERGRLVESGFDVVLGNPPYVRLQTLKQKDARYADALKENYAAASKGNYDLYVVFVERGLQLLKSAGVLAYILPHKFFNAKYGEPLRKLIAQGRSLSHVVHFGDQQVFPGSTNYVCLMFLDKHGVEACRYVKADDLEAWLATRQGTEGQVRHADVTPREWNFVVGREARFFERLSDVSPKLGEVARAMFVGQQTSADTVYLFEEHRSTEERTLEVFSKELSAWVGLERSVLKSVVRSGSIGRYWATPNAFVLFPYEVEGNGARLFTRVEMAERFPLAWEYLRTNRAKLAAREKGKFADDAWYRFGRSQNLGMWEQPKLMIPYMVTDLSAYLDDSASLYFINVTTGGYGVTVRPGTLDLACLCAMLNSTVLDFFLKQVSTNFHGGYFAANKQFIEQLPLPGAEHDQQAAMSGLVRAVQCLRRRTCTDTPDTNKTPSAAPPYLERLLSALVYELFFVAPGPRAFRTQLPDKLLSAPSHDLGCNAPQGRPPSFHFMVPTHPELSASHSR